MSAKLFNLAQMTTATTGTGSITLTAEVLGALSFSGAGVQDGDTIGYSIRDGVNSEIGYGVYTAATKVLTRTVIKSTNADGPINLSGNAWSPSNPGGILVSITPSVADIERGELVAIIQDRKSSGTSGGSFTSGGWRTRDLNTIAYNRNSIVSLSSNRFTIPIGTWLIRWRSPGYYVRQHKSMLFNYTDNATVEIGSNAFCDNGTTGWSQTDSVGTSVVSISASKAFVIHHYCNTSYASGFGLALSFGVDEIYSTVEIYRA